MPLESVLAAVRPLFESPDIAKCAHNANYDMAVLAGARHQNRRNLDFDTMIAAHLLGRSYMPARPERICPWTFWVTGDDPHLPANRNGAQADLPSTRYPSNAGTADYAAADADITFRLRDVFEGQQLDNGTACAG